MKFAFLFSLFFLSILSFAQGGFKRNSVYFELGGAGLFTSMNYERQVTAKPGLGFRTGIGFYSFRTPEVTIPVGVNYLLPISKNRYGDIGFSTTWSSADVKLYAIVDRKFPTQGGYQHFNYIPSVGYRWQTERNWLFRLNLLLVVNDYGPLPFLGFAVGKCF